VIVQSVASSFRSFSGSVRRAIHELAQKHLGGLVPFGRKPLQKSAVSTPFHQNPFPAWRLNSALTGIGQRRQGGQEKVPDGPARNSRFFHRPASKGNQPAPALWRQFMYGGANTPRKAAKG